MSLKHKNKKIYFISAIIILVLVFFVAWMFVPAPAAQVLVGYQKIEINSNVINVESVTTPAQWVKGLSGRTSLAFGTGMLFVFDREDEWGIWMKDMNFPIDVLWIAGDLKVVKIVENMSPSSYPASYSPDRSVKYVLELPAGAVKKYGINVGQSMKF